MSSSLWQIYPDYIRQAFTLSFTYGIQEPNARIIEKELAADADAAEAGHHSLRLRADGVRCPPFEKNGEHIRWSVQHCGSPIYTDECPKDFEMPLYPGAKLYRCVTEKGNDDLESVTGAVIENRLKKGLVRRQKHVPPDLAGGVSRIIPSGKWDRGKASRSGRGWRLISAMGSSGKLLL